MQKLKTYLSPKEVPYILSAALLGTLCHFLYEWSGQAAFFALFCPVNESPWEHLKLLFFPVFIISVLQYLMHRRYLPAKRFFYSRFLGVLCAMAFILAAFYTYSGIFGSHFLVLDIVVYLAGVLTAFLVSAYFLRFTRKCVPDSAIIIALWLSLSICFFVFTCFPPEIPLFLPPVQ